MMSRCYAALLLCFGLPALAFPLSSAGQADSLATLAGQVTDAETGATLPGAHVFIAASMMGTATDAEGRYLLENVPLGAHRLYASMVGYEAEAIDTLLSAPGRLTLDFRLRPDIVELGEVKVEAREDRRWQRRLRRFERLFLGETANAEQTTFINPEVLAFDGGWGTLKAHANEPLVFENRALGYRVQYFLKEFIHAGTTTKYDGEPLYEPLIPENAAEADRWDENRRRAFYGSFRHYLLALLRGRTQEEGFITYRRFDLDSPYRADERFGVNLDRLLEAGPTPEEKLLTFNGFLEIVYTAEEEEEAFLRWQGRYAFRAPANQHSWIELNDGPTPVDRHGEVIDPYGVTVYGYFAFERIADQLPKEYRPPDARPKP